MNRYTTIVILFVTSLVLIATSAPALDMENFHISGHVHTYAKMQDSYQTPLDEIYEVREGANYRENQHFRAKTVLDFTYGKPEDKWFGMAQIAVDANDPDHGDSDNENASTITVGEDFSAILAMYRPFEVQGGRPFGIALGVLPIKPTANAAYFNYFLGDIEEDFILYTASGIVHSPGIGLDFHVSKDTGFGVSYLNGVEDGSQIAALMESDSAHNFIVWGEAKKWGLGWNGAIQSVRGTGSKDVSLVEVTPAGNELYAYESESSHRLFNTMLTYTVDLKAISIMPGIGYQGIYGESCAISTSGLAERDIKMDNYQAGFKIFTRFFNIPGEFSVLYTDTETEDFDAFGQLTSAAGNAAIDLAGVQGAGLPSGWWNQSNISALGALATAPEIAAAGTSESVAGVAGIDNDLHLEYKFDITDNVQLGLFYFRMDSQQIDTESSFRQMDGSLTDQRLTAILAGSGNPAPDATADALLRGVAENVAQQFEWTDMESYGLFCNVQF